MLLSFHRLCRLAEELVLATPYVKEDGTFGYKQIDLENINSASIDLTLGRYVMQEEAPDNGEYLRSLRDRKPLAMKKIDIEETGFIIAPGEFVLAQSEEVFFLPPNISSEYKLKSSMARIGLEHLNAGWCDAGWHGSVLTLELKNMTTHHYIEIKAGDKIGQMVFFEHETVPDDRSYAARGRYNNDKQVTKIKE